MLVTFSNVLPRSSGAVPTRHRHPNPARMPATIRHPTSVRRGHAGQPCLSPPKPSAWGSTTGIPWSGRPAPGPLGNWNPLIPWPIIGSGWESRTTGPFGRRSRGFLLRPRNAHDEPGSCRIGRGRLLGPALGLFQLSKIRHHRLGISRIRWVGSQAGGQSASQGDRSY